jgi:Spy/CpxP family protein refolding chaperone
MGEWDYRTDGAPGWYGMGPGMMDWAEPGYGWGTGRPYGMMGRYGMGIGLGMVDGGYAMMLGRIPDLTSEQIEKIGKLQAGLAERNRGVTLQRLEAQARLDRLYAAEKRDWNAIRAASLALFDLQRRQLDTAIDLQQEIDGLLTESQRREMARTWRGYGWMERNK